MTNKLKLTKQKEMLNEEVKRYNELNKEIALTKVDVTTYKRIIINNEKIYDELHALNVNVHMKEMAWLI